MVHQEVFGSECCLFSHRFVGFHDRIDSSGHVQLVSLVNVIQDDLQLRRIGGGHIDQVLAVHQLQRLAWAIDESLFHSSVGLLIIDNQVEIERNNIVSYLEGVVQMELLIPGVEQVLVLHSQRIEPNLGKTCGVCFSYYSRSKVGLLN